MVNAFTEKVFRLVSEELGYYESLIEMSKGAKAYAEAAAQIGDTPMVEYWKKVQRETLEFAKLVFDLKV